MFGVQNSEKRVRPQQVRVSQEAKGGYSRSRRRIGLRLEEPHSRRVLDALVGVGAHEVKIRTYDDYEYVERRHVKPERVGRTKLKDLTGAHIDNLYATKLTLPPRAKLSGRATYDESSTSRVYLFLHLGLQPESDKHGSRVLRRVMRNSERRRALISSEHVTLRDQRLAVEFGDLFRYAVHQFYEFGRRLYLDLRTRAQQAGRIVLDLRARDSSIYETASLRILLDLTK